MFYEPLIRCDKSIGGEEGIASARCRGARRSPRGGVRSNECPFAPLTPIFVFRIWSGQARPICYKQKCPDKIGDIHFICGEEGIRTLDTLSSIHTFQACSFNHSDTSPDYLVRLRHSSQHRTHRISGLREALHGPRPQGGPARGLQKYNFPPYLPNIFCAFSVVIRATSSTETPFTSASFSAT